MSTNLRDDLVHLHPQSDDVSESDEAFVATGPTSPDAAPDVGVDVAQASPKSMHEPVDIPEESSPIGTQESDDAGSTEETLADTAPEAPSEEAQVSTDVTEPDKIETESAGQLPDTEPVVESAAAEPMPSEDPETVQAEEPTIPAEPSKASADAAPPKPASPRPPALPDIDYEGVEDNRLIREVYAAPHKVYLLNKVRKAIAAAGDSELAIQLKFVEADILHQVAERQAAKESLCERAEAIKDSTSWKVTGDAYKALFDEWKQVG